MSTLLVVLLVMVSEVMGGPRPHSHQHHRFRSVETRDRLPFETKPCSGDHIQKMQEYMAASKCGDPKEVFVELEREAAHEMIIPSSVWVKRCVGLCYSSGYDSNCVPLKTQIKHIPVRITNVQTHKERCATVPVEEHLSCGCCDGSAELCSSSRPYDPRKCACRCPNNGEKRRCRSKRNQTMRWNRSKCICEEVPQAKRRSSS